jgi:hypothetical protein
MRKATITCYNCRSRIEFNQPQDGGENAYGTLELQSIKCVKGLLTIIYKQKKIFGER